MAKRLHTRTIEVRLILDPANQNCIGCYFGFGNGCAKSKNEYFKNISCVGRASDGTELMGKFISNPRR